MGLVTGRCLMRMTSTDPHARKCRLLPVVRKKQNRSGLAGAMAFQFASSRVPGKSRQGRSTGRSKRFSCGLASRKLWHTRSLSSGPMAAAQPKPAQNEGTVTSSRRKPHDPCRTGAAAVATAGISANGRSLQRESFRTGRSAGLQMSKKRSSRSRGIERMNATGYTPCDVVSAGPAHSAGLLANQEPDPAIRDGDDWGEAVRGRRSSENRFGQSPV